MDGTLEQIRRRRQINAGESAFAGTSKKKAGAAAKLLRSVVEGAELRAVTVGLFEVVAEDLLVLSRVLADLLLEPVGEPLV